MSVIDKLSSSLDRKDEVPNQELAQEIANSNDSAAIAELIENLTNKKPIQNDCIKVLYEVGRINPSLISDYLPTFLGLLSSKNNRLQWGGMIAIGILAPERPKDIYDALPNILAAADNGSVITKDHAFNILIELATVKDFEQDAIPLMIEQLNRSATNQLPMYAEKIIPVANAENKTMFIDTLSARLAEVELESKKKRIDKVIRKLSKL